MAKSAKGGSSERGEYRPIMTAFADDADVHALSGNAVKLWLMLKLTLPAPGIGVVYPSKLCDQVNVDRAQLEELLRELEAAKPGHQYGWIMRDRNLVWMINGLRWEPALSAANVKHIPFIRRVVAGLDQNSAVVIAFRNRYREWFQGHSIPSGKGSDTQAIGSQVGSDTQPIASAKASDRVSEHKTKQNLRSKAEDLDPERAAAAQHTKSRSAAVSAPLADAREPAAAGKPPNGNGAEVLQLYGALPAKAKQFISVFYPKGHATPRRREDVMRQISRTLTGGTPIRKGQIVFAISVARLEKKCEQVMTERVRDPDKAIFVLLIKLADTTDVSEAAVRASKAERRVEERQTAAELSAAEAWIATHPDAERGIASALEEQGLARGDASSAEGRLATVCWNVTRTSLLLAAWRNRGDAARTGGMGETAAETAVETAGVGA